jgi:hypothetical protein
MALHIDSETAAEGNPFKHTDPPIHFQCVSVGKGPRKDIASTLPVD